MSRYQQNLNSNVNKDNQSISRHSQQRNYQQKRQNSGSLSSSRPTSPTSPISPSGSTYRTINNSNPFDDNQNSVYSPKNFYNNDTNSRVTERRDSQQKKIIWDPQLEKQPRQQQQKKYQQYTQLPRKNSVELQVKANQDNENLNNDSINVDNDQTNDQVTVANFHEGIDHEQNNDDDDDDDDDEEDDDDDGDDDDEEEEEEEEDDDDDENESEEEEEDDNIEQGETDFFQNAYSPRNDFKSRISAISMAEHQTSSQTLFRSNSVNNPDQNDVEMNVLNDNKVSRSKSYRPRPHAAKAVPLNDDDGDGRKSPTRGLLRIPSMMRGANSENNNPPRRQKSLVRPERARDTYYRRTSRGRYDGSDEESRRWSVFSGGDDRRKSSMSLARMKEPPKKRKWYKCQCPSCWVLFSRIITFWAPPSLLSCCGMGDRLVQQAWREKIALVFVIFILCIVVGFLTFGLQTVFCRKPALEGILFGHLSLNQATILGKVYDLSSYQHIQVPPFVNNSDLSSPDNGFGRSDLTFLFQYVNFECQNVLTPQTSVDGKVLNYFPCVPVHEEDSPNPNANPGNHGCHPEPSQRVDALSLFNVVGEVHFDWSDIDNSDKYIVYNNQILDLSLFEWTVPNIQLPDTLRRIIDDENNVFHGRDVTHYLHSDPEKIQLAKCIQEIVKVGVIDSLPISCLATGVITYVSFIVIVSVVLVRFFLAVLFGWILSWRLGNFREETAEEIAKREKDIERWTNESHHYRESRQSGFFNKSRFSTLPPPGAAPFRRQDRPGSRVFSQSAMTKDSNVRTSRPSSFVENHSRANSMSSTSSSTFNHIPGLNLANETRFNFQLMHTIMLVTCYSEGRQGIKTTLQSLAYTDYPTSHKLIMMIADGIIFGAGNEHSTPDICLSLMSDLITPVENVVAHSYVAIADGKKRHNMAKVYAGYYKCKDQNDPTKSQRIPMVTIVKCGGPDEQDDKKPGNRGKRDSQMILMSFLQKVMFDERMTPLEYEFFNSIRTVTGVTPDFFEIVLMVDADTKIYPDSVTRMVACMARDPSIMGLCGETKISNKSDSWVTMIQVFEYYISHHMQKAFESIFGGVTCLPGCFCMYRIKAPKGPNGYWVPILANPDIVEQYSENIVDTLHKKNLLLLGEDRYLSTLMLRSFPKRKMVFVPQAVCKTIVPDTFRVLRSQRRRWINSTVHNLLELVLIPDLCGTFCFSMQFVIFMELVGTVVLPAAISFTLYLIIISFIKKPVPYLPLALLAIVLGLPAILILLTTRKIVYVGWMLIYLFSLPIWNFVLPVYAYWHFDDFSWGQTRKVEGEEAGADHSRKEGEFDSTKIVMKRWAEWEREKQLKHRRSSFHQQISSVPIGPEDPYQFNGIRTSAMNAINDNKSYYPTPSPLNPALRAAKRTTMGVGGMPKTTKTRVPTDSLMIPPQLSSPSSESTTNSSSTLTASTEPFVSTPTEIDHNYHQNIIPRNSNNYNYNNNGNNLPSNYEEAYLRQA